MLPVGIRLQNAIATEELSGDKVRSVSSDEHGCHGVVACGRDNGAAKVGRARVVGSKLLAVGHGASSSNLQLGHGTRTGDNRSVARGWVVLQDAHSPLGVRGGGAPR